jgi:hypothetical protein
MINDGLADSSPSRPLSERRRPLSSAQRRKQQLVMQDGLRPIQRKRVANCGRIRIAGHVELRRRTDTGRAFFDHVLKCGSVWECPMCSAKIRAERSFAGKKVATFEIRDGERVAVAPVSQHEFALVVGAPQVVWHAWLRQGRPLGSVPPPPPPVDQVVAVQHCVHRAHGRRVHVRVAPLQALSDLRRPPTRLRLLERHDQLRGAIWSHSNIEEASFRNGRTGANFAGAAGGLQCEGSHAQYISTCGESWSHVASFASPLGPTPMTSSSRELPPPPQTQTRSARRTPPSTAKPRLTKLRQVTRWTPRRECF